MGETAVGGAVEREHTQAVGLTAGGLSCQHSQQSECRRHMSHMRCRCRGGPESMCGSELARERGTHVASMRDNHASRDDSPNYRVGTKFHLRGYLKLTRN